MRFDFSQKVVLFICFLYSFPFFAQALRFEERPNGILLLENDSPRYFYRSSEIDGTNAFSRSNYIHPLYDNEGEIITEDFPEDHPHHHGIFWAWHQLYLDGKRIADPWLNENITWEVLKTETKIKENQADLIATVNWIIKSTGDAVMREKVIVSFKRISEAVYSLDFTIELTALKNGLTLGGSEDNKGYGGFSARLKLPSDVVFTSEKGKVEPKNLPVKVGPWVNVSEHFDASSEISSGVVIMGEPEKLPQYQGWILRSENSMQNMAFPGKNSISIKRGENLSFRNQLLVHKGLKTEEINRFYKAFKAAKLLP
jgi:hypothetical protein